MKNKINRREFITVAAGTVAASTGAELISSYGFGNQIRTDAVVPKRAFGNTGMKISKLCLGGGSFAGTDNQALLDEALKYGVDCWEVVSFTGKTYGDYFKRHPEIREKVFLSGKVYSTDPDLMQKQLDNLLDENGTSIIDFLAVWVLDNTAVLTDKIRKWAENAKKQKKIKFFGFCTHRDMAKCLRDGAELGWIDGIQTVYNYRLQGINDMQDALQRCHEKGIGIFTIKSMGLTVRSKDELQRLPINEERMNSLLAVHDISFEQAKLKAIWQNPDLTSVCSLMPNSTILKANISAAMDDRPLNEEIKKLLADYSNSTGQYFCRRCGLCDTANADSIPIFDIMELLMYLRGYGMKDMAAKKFAQIPIEIRGKIHSSDYSGAEKICPQKMPIAQLMKEACMEFSK